jgi:hypothetical protein
MFPHPQTVYQVRELDRRLLLDRIARERAVRVAFAQSTSRSDLSGRRLVLPLPRIVPLRLGLPPLAWLVHTVGASRAWRTIPRTARSAGG